MSGKATHIDYKHPKHLRVVTGEQYPAYSASRGHYTEDALCVAPSSDMYKKLFRNNLPKWKGQ